METPGASETFLNFYQTTRCHIPGGSLFFIAVIEYYFDERCTNPGHQVTRDTKFAAVAPNICGIGFVSLFWRLGCWKVRASVAVAQLVRHRATSRKVAGPIPDGVIGIFH